jgi:hypothetical protein
VSLLAWNRIFGGSRRSSLTWVVGAILSLGMLVRAQAQQAPPATAEAVLVEMASHAGVIFAGQVLQITHADQNGYVEIKFQVSVAVRGCSSDRPYILREWAGLWSGGQQRYEVGQRLLMVLTAPGKSGLSAPVNGTDGVIPVLANAQPALMQGANPAPADTGVSQQEAFLADLRWVRAQAVRGIAPAAATAPIAKAPVVNAHLVTATPNWSPVTNTPFVPVDDTWVGPVAPLTAGGPANGNGTSTEPSLTSILVLLGTAGAA